MQKIKFLFLSILLTLTGCTSMYGGSKLSDESLQSDIAGVLGETPSNIIIESRRSEGVNTFVTVKTKKGARLACTLSGGGIMVYGLRTPASCKPI